MAFTVNQIEGLENQTSIHRVKYDAIVGDSTYKKEFVMTESGVAALMTRDKAYKIADILAQKVTNAKNIEVQVRGIGEFGETIFTPVFIAKVEDLSTFDEIV